MSRLVAVALLAGAIGCTNATPVGTVLGERDLSNHIPEEIRDRVSAEDHSHRFGIRDTSAQVEAHLTTGTDPTTGSAWVRNVRFVVVANDDQQIHPPAVSGPLNLGTTERPVASYAFQIAYVEESLGSTVSGTVAGRFGGDGSLSVDD